MKRTKMIWNRLLGTLLILAFGVYAFEYFILNNKVLWKEKGFIIVKDLPSDLRSRFTKLQELMAVMSVLMIWFKIIQNIRRIYWNWPHIIKISLPMYIAIRFARKSCWKSRSMKV